jgi:iron-sulfur cluster repair protein YtfE (RIC family)
MKPETQTEETDRSEQSLSFLSLLDIHDRLNEMFYEHQEALLMLDLDLALERLDQFEMKLRDHMKHEEELLLPVYERAGKIPGGPAVFFTGEHRRMLEFLTRFRETLSRLLIERADLKRQIIALFDQEATFKSLVEHHDQRERNILYPALDRVTTDEERRRLLEAS